MRFYLTLKHELDGVFMVKKLSFSHEGNKGYFCVTSSFYAGLLTYGAPSGVRNKKHLKNRELLKKIAI